MFFTPRWRELSKVWRVIISEILSRKESCFQWRPVCDEGQLRLCCRQNVRLFFAHLNVFWEETNCGSKNVHLERLIKECYFSDIVGLGNCFAEILFWTQISVIRAFSSYTVGKKQLGKFSIFDHFVLTFRIASLFMTIDSAHLCAL